jgi:hypothetical protein
MNYPFVKNFEELFANIMKDIKEDGYVSLYIADKSEESIFEKILVQELKRNVKGKEISFVGIRNIVLKPNFKSKKLFTKFVENLETLNVPLMFHDIINEKLIPFFNKKGYSLYKEKKYEQLVTSMYKI